MRRMMLKVRISLLKRGRSSAKILAPSDPLSFKPNPSALMGASSKKGRKEEEEHSAPRQLKNSRRSPTPSDDENGGDARDGIYRAPKMAAVPYVESRGKSRPCSVCSDLIDRPASFSISTNQSTCTSFAFRIRVVSYICSVDRVYFRSRRATRRHLWW